MASDRQFSTGGPKWTGSRPYRLPPWLACATALLAAAGLGVVAPAARAETGKAAADVNVLASWEFLDSGEWGPADRQAGFGLDVDYRGPRWPFSVVGSYFLTSDEGSERAAELRVAVTELDLGLRKIWAPTTWLLPYVGGGFATFRVDSGRTTAARKFNDDGNWAAGGWLGVGTYFRVLQDLNLGVDARWSMGTDVSVHQQKRDPGGWRLGVLLGYHWDG